jgi:hypothetical protein
MPTFTDPARDANEAYDPTWLRLVRKPVGVDRRYGLAEVVG